MDVVREAEPDPGQFDPKSPYYDAKSSVEKPKWFAPFVEFREKFEEIVSLEDLKRFRDQGSLKDLEVLKLSRLSVSKVRPDEFGFIQGISMARDMAKGQKEKT